MKLLVSVPQVSVHCLWHLLLQFFVENMTLLPIDLEKDSYIDPAVRNLIVLDDLMTTAAKDPRITDLFTEGSHHRNLSVIVLSQEVALQN
jgi:hypothetical protein